MAALDRPATGAIIVIVTVIDPRYMGAPPGRM
jgi:hypothetical protein